MFGFKSAFTGLRFTESDHALRRMILEGSMCNDRPLPPLEGQVVYVRAVIAKRAECGQLRINIQQPNNTATVVVDPKEIRREDRERLGIT
jgi:hypothetical protein